MIAAEPFKRRRGELQSRGQLHLVWLTLGPAMAARPKVGLLASTGSAYAVADRLLTLRR